MLRSFNPAAISATPGKPRTALIKLSYATHLKPLIDRSLACAALLLLAPLLMLIAFIILCANGRPIFFCQRRIGHRFTPFTIVKFRTMSNQQVTGLGGFLRQTGLDELPQLWNIVRGDMSWIGPRPLTEQDIERLGWQQAYYRRRWRARPGITGLAQLYGGVGRKVTWLCDRTYVHSISAHTDIKILLVSVLICIFGKRTVRRRIYQMRRKSNPTR